MRRRKRVLMITLAIVMGLSLMLAGCGNGGLNKGKDEETGKGTSAGTDTGKGEAGQQADKGDDRKVVNLSLWEFALNLNNTEGIKNDPVKKFVEDKLKLNIKMMTGDLEKIKLLVTTDQAPDVFSVPLWLPGAKDFIKDAIKEDMFVDIGKMVFDKPEKYPVLAKIFKDKEFKLTNKMFAGDQDKYYSAWAGIYSNPASYGDPAFNMRILNKLNLPLPQTVDEFVNVLRQIKKSDPNLIPFGFLNYQGTNFPNELDSIFFSTYGTRAKDMQIDKDGNWYDSTIDPRNKEVWKLLQGMYKEGLFDKEAFTKDDYYHGTNDFANGKTAAVSFALPNTNYKMYAWLFDEFKKVNPDAKVEDIQLLPHPLSGPAGKQFTRSAPFAVANAIAIPKSSKNPERALEFIEWAFSNEGQTTKFYGLEGVHYTKDSSGNLVLNTDAWKKVTDVWGIQDIHGMLFNFIYAGEAMLDYENNGWFEAHKKQRFVAVERAEHTPVNDYITDLIANWQKETFVEAPFYEANVVISDDMKTISAKLNDIRQNYFVKFFVGELDVDSNWDKFVQEYKAAGADKYVAEYAAAAKKAKEDYDSIK